LDAVDAPLNPYDVTLDAVDALLDAFRVTSYAFNLPLYASKVTLYRYGVTSYAFGITSYASDVPLYAFQIFLYAFDFLLYAGSIMLPLKHESLYGAPGVAHREARTWYQKSRELAVQLKNQIGLGQAAQNIGIVCTLEGDAARERGNESAAQRHFEEARRSVEESRQIGQARGNKPDEAGSWCLLAQIHLRLGDLAAAERHAHEDRKFHESLGLKEAWMDYNTLSEIAQTRGDLAAAAEWAKKRDDVLAELKRRARGGGGL
jgi:hypothetical protein